MCDLTTPPLFAPSLPVPVSTSVQVALRTVGEDYKKSKSGADSLSLIRPPGSGTQPQAHAAATRGVQFACSFSFLKLTLFFPLFPFSWQVILCMGQQDLYICCVSLGCG